MELVGPVLIEEEIDLPYFVEEFEQGVLFVKLHGSAKVFCTMYITGVLVRNNVIIFQFNNFSNVII